VFLSFSLPFWCLSCLLLVLWLFLLLDDLLDLFLVFGLLVVLYGVLDSNFKLCAFCCAIPRSEKAEMKSPYMCPGCSNHTYNNNMINMCYVR
jgi:hypothetical protein